MSWRRKRRMLPPTCWVSMSSVMRLGARSRNLSIWRSREYLRLWRFKQTPTRKLLLKKNNGWRTWTCLRNRVPQSYKGRYQSCRSMRRLIKNWRSISTRLMTTRMRSMRSSSRCRRGTTGCTTCLNKKTNRYSRETSNSAKKTSAKRKRRLSSSCRRWGRRLLRR